jgi:dihydroorotate dehydrogenase electron transfer subunit
MINKQEKPVILKIKKIKSETPQIKTFSFEYPLGAKPGQFIMLWIPRVDQKPISISRQTKNGFELTVFKIGKATEELFKMKVGDKVGISGPYGNSFGIKPKSKVAVVGGGCGSAPMRFLADELKKAKCTVTFITGAKTGKDVLFKKEFPGTCVVTDDGSEGMKGYTTQKLEEILSVRNAHVRSQQKIDKVYTCGPEIMMKKIVELCKKYKVPCEISMERYMKCGFGICGQCAVDPLGICICQDGPVFSDKIAKKITEFGKYHRDKTGIKHNF